MKEKIKAFITLTAMIAFILFVIGAALLSIVGEISRYIVWIKWAFGG